ncbi:MAG: hypothetical protein V4634_06975 [Pseudomonadota bacterium]
MHILIAIVVLLALAYFVNQAVQRKSGGDNAQAGLEPAGPGLEVAFIAMYSRKPLTSASGPTVSADIKSILLKGKRIDAEKALRQEASVNGVPSLVPKSWQLISRNRQGVERVLASNVVSYDITPDGKIIYSNGRGVFLLTDGDESRLILRSDVVADVVGKK